MTDLPNVKPESRSETVLAAPDKIAKIRDLFGIDSDMPVVWQIIIFIGGILPAVLAVTGILMWLRTRRRREKYRRAAAFAEAEALAS